MSEGIEHWLAEAAQARAEAGLTRATVPVTDDLVDIAGNDYLGLRTHPDVVAGAIGALERYGAGAGASRLVTGTHPIHADLESALAELTGAPAALVLSTGYHANLSVLTALADAGTLIVSDAHNHASIIDGARLSRAAVSVARHGDAEHVATLLGRREQTRAIVVVESVYSVLGDEAPLADLAEICSREGAILVVDDAHGLGVVGNRGEGGSALHGLTGHPDVVTTTTLSKSLGSQGGAVLGSQAVREHLVGTARPFIYDTGLAPAAAGAALAALEVMAAEPERVTRVRAVAAELAASVGAPPPAGAVLSAPMPGPQEALAAQADAARGGIRVGCFRPPSTPDGSSRLRITASAGLGDDALRAATSVLRSLVPGGAS